MSTPDWSLLPLECRISMFRNISNLDAAPFWYNEKRKTIDTRRVSLPACLALASTCKAFSFAWRIFITRHVMDYICAVIRGMQLRCFIRAGLGSWRGHYDSSKARAVFDSLRLSAAKNAALCTVSIGSIYNDQRCIAESLRRDDCDVSAPSNLLPHALEIRFYLDAQLFNAADVIDNHTVRIDDKIHERKFELEYFPAQYNFGALDSERVFRFDENAQFIGYVLPDYWDHQCNPAHFYLRTIDLCYKTPPSNTMRSLYGAFYHGNNKGEPDFRDRHSWVEMITTARIGLSGIAQTSWESSLSLPSELFSTSLLENSLSVCFVRHPEQVAAAMHKTHGTVEAARRVVSFKILMMALRHFLLFGDFQFWPVRAHRPGLGHSAANEHSRTYSRSMHSMNREIVATHGIKLSDVGIMSAADAILHGFVHEAYPRATDMYKPLTLSRRVDLIQSALINDPKWLESAANHQRFKEFELSNHERLIDIDTVFQSTHKGARAIWHYLESNSTNVSEIVITDAVDKSLPSLYIRRSQSSIVFGASMQRSTAMRLRSDGPSSYDWSHRTQARNWKPICTFAANQLGHDRELQLEFVIIWRNGARDYDTRSFSDDVSRSDAETYYVKLARHSILNMQDARGYFRPLTRRIFEMFERIAAIPGDAARQEYVASIAMIKSTLCAQCTRPKANCQCKRSKRPGLLMSDMRKRARFGEYPDDNLP